MSTERNDALHFLAAVDGSEHSLAAVRWIARTGSGGVRLRCTLLNVQRPIMSGEVGLIAPASITQEARDRSAADILEHASAILRSAGIPFATEERLDDAAATVVARAQALGCDAIIIGRRGLGALRSVLLGSVSSEVVRRSDLPVIIVNPLATDLPAVPLRLLVAVDGSDGAMRAVAFAARLAAACAGEVHAAHVRPTLTMAGAAFGSRDKLIEHWSGGQADEALAKVRGLLVREHIKHAEHVLAGDDCASTILDAAQVNSCGIVAMGTRGLGPVTGLLLGSVAQGVLQHAPAAVSAVVLVR